MPLPLHNHTEARINSARSAASHPCIFVPGLSDPDPDIQPNEENCILESIKSKENVTDSDDCNAPLSKLRALHKAIVVNMKDDAITLLVEKDPLILSFGSRLLGKHGSNENSIKSYISQKMCELRRLMEASKMFNKDIKTLHDIIEPVQCIHLVNTVKRVAGYNETKSDFDTFPCIKNRLQPDEMCKNIADRCNLWGDELLAKSARSFLTLYATEWQYAISNHAHQTLENAQYNKPKMLQVRKDVVILHKYLRKLLNIESDYFFARPASNTVTPYRGNDVLRIYAMECGTKSPNLIQSTKLRQQMGTLSQVFNVSETNQNTLASFMAHDIRVHRTFYRLPENVLQAAKVTKLLHAINTGTIAKYKGKDI